MDKETVGPLFFPCCDHCGCLAGERIGHDDTCNLGCNDSTRCWVGKGIVEDEEKLEFLLKNNWEPFAVTSGGQAGYTYHFRRKVND